MSPVRRTASITWRRLVPMQRMSPIVRVWRATRVLKVVAMTMTATIAHTGARTLRMLAIIVPPCWFWERWEMTESLS